MHPQAKEKAQTVEDKSPPPADYNPEMDGPWSPSSITYPLRGRFDASVDALGTLSLFLLSVCPVLSLSSSSLFALN